MKAEKIIIAILAVLILTLDFFGSFYFIAGIKPSDLIARINPQQVVNKLLINPHLSDDKVTETETNSGSNLQLISDDLIKDKMIPVINSRKLSLKLRSSQEYLNLTPKVKIKAPDFKNERIYWERDFDLVSVKGNNNNLYEFDISDFFQKGTFLLDINFYDEKGTSVFSLLDQEVILGPRAKITNATVKTLNNKDFVLNVSVDDEQLPPDPSWEIIAVVCSKDQCAFAKKDLAEGWPKELKLDRKIEGRNLTITLIIKAKELKGYVNSYISH
ncbi:hypothetical protein HY030_01030 [Candidatus Gottesmanbacteria bacterium]|nr:hypothetical protein [Candidatus Gottesmanbacteria bacterium]